MLVRRGANGTTVDVTPRDHNVRSRVHEYGGGAYLVSKSFIYYSNFADPKLQPMILKGIAWAAKKPTDALMTVRPARGRSNGN